MSDAAELMASEDVGSLPILDGDKLTGVVTDRDIVIRAVAKKKDPQGMPVREVATHDPVTVRADDYFADALKLMATYQVRRLPSLMRTTGSWEFLHEPMSRWALRRRLSARWSRKSHRRRQALACRSTDAGKERGGESRPFLSLSSEDHQATPDATRASAVPMRHARLQCVSRGGGGGVIVRSFLGVSGPDRCGGRGGGRWWGGGGGGGGVGSPDGNALGGNLGAERTLAGVRERPRARPRPSRARSLPARPRPAGSRAAAPRGPRPLRVDGL